MSECIPTSGKDGQKWGIPNYLRVHISGDQVLSPLRSNNPQQNLGAIA